MDIASYIQGFCQLDKRKNDEAQDSGYSFIGEIIGQLLIGVLLAIGGWFLSRPWSWWVFFVTGLVLMFGIPLFFLIRRK